VQHDHPSVVLLAYLDDIHLLGAPKDVGAAHEALVKALKEVKLECRPDKCYVWSPSGEYGELPQVLTVSEQAGMIILGVPIGTYAPEEMVTCVETLDPASKYKKAMHKKLVGIESLAEAGFPYSALMLLRVCAAPSVNHLLRAQPPSVTGAAAERSDALLLKTFLKILSMAASEVPAGSVAEGLLHLPTSQGGLGVQSAVQAMSRAHLASWAAVAPEMAKRCSHLAADIAAIFTTPVVPTPAAPGAPPPPPPPPPPALLPYQLELQAQRSKLEVDSALDLTEVTLAEPQRHWQHTLGEATAVRTRAQLGARVKAAALGAPDELQHMAHWHSTLEHGRGAYLMRFATFKALSLGPLTMAIRRHLRLRLPGLVNGSKCACGHKVDAYGDHADVCSRLAGPRNFRHDMFRDDAVLAPCKQVGLPATREEPDLIPGTRERPADVLVPFGLELDETAPCDCGVMLDAKVVGSCANSYLDAGAANAPGVALAHGFASKLRGARRLPSGTILVPIVASSQGGVHESLPLLYKKLAGLWQSQGDGRDGSTEGLQAQWMADASTSLQRGQFCLIQRLIAGVARCDPQLGISPQNWQPQMPEDVSAYMVHTRAAH
jgi:hypothetical protein